jgi:hypothetical protein
MEDSSMNFTKFRLFKIFFILLSCLAFWETGCTHPAVPSPIPKNGKIVLESNGHETIPDDSSSLKPSRTPQLVRVGTNTFWKTKIDSGRGGASFPQSYCLESIAWTNDWFCSPSIIAPERYEVSLGGSVSVFDSDFDLIVEKQLDGCPTWIQPNGSFVVTLVFFQSRPKDGCIYLKFSGDAAVLMDLRRQLRYYRRVK